MATETAAPAGPDLPDRRVTEREARFSSGLPMLVAGIVLLLAGREPCLALGHPPVRQVRACGCCSLGSHLLPPLPNKNDIFDQS